MTWAKQKMAHFFLWRILMPKKIEISYWSEKMTALENKNMLTVLSAAPP